MLNETSSDAGAGILHGANTLGLHNVKPVDLSSSSIPNVAADPNSCIAHDSVGTRGGLPSPETSCPRSSSE